MLFRSRCGLHVPAGPARVTDRDADVSADVMPADRSRAIAGRFIAVHTDHARALFWCGLFGHMHAAGFKPPPLKRRQSYRILSVLGAF